MPRQEVGQVKRARLGIGELCKALGAGKKLIAMHARQPLDSPAFFLDHAIDLTAGAAIRISHVNASVLGFETPDLFPQARRYLLRTIVQLCVDALHVHMVPAMRLLQLVDFPSQGATGDHEYWFRHARPPGKLVCRPSSNDPGPRILICGE